MNFDRSICLTQRRWERRAMHTIADSADLRLCVRSKLLYEDIAFLAVLRDVEAEYFFFRRDADSHEHIDNFQNNECHDDAENPGHSDGNKLAFKRRAAFEQSHRLVVVEVPRSAGGEDTRENCAECATHA